MFLIASVNPKADPFPGFSWFTNSTMDAVLVVAAIVLFVQLATRKVSVIPTPAQNFLEWLIETVYAALESIVGKHMIRQVFPLLCSFFLFILVANWSALLPGVGTIGWGESVQGHFEVTTPLLRPANADLNMTLALTSLFMVYWLYWSIKENGLVGFLLHIFGPKGGLKGFLKYLLMPIFFGVGLIEVISIASRGISLPIRLYGNIYAGKSLVHAMSEIAGPWWGILISMPFYVLEILIGLLQALVFMLLCAVYIQLSTAHEEGEHSH